MKRRSAPPPVGAGREDFGGGSGPKRQRVSDGGSSAPPPHRGGPGPQHQGPCAFKLLCPDSLVVRLLGARGSKVETVQADTNTYFSFSRRDAYYPGTRMRLLVIRAEEPDPIMDAIACVVDEIVRCAEEEQGQLGEGQDGDFFTASGNYRIMCALCQKSAGSVIGLKGQRIGAMRLETGATINIRSEVVEGHQMVEIDGSVDQLFKVLEQMNRTVQADTGAAWFADWASQKSFGEAPGAPGPEPSAPRRKGGGVGGTAGGGHDRGHAPTGAHEFRGEGATIFVKGLSSATTTADLHRYFSHYGGIDEAEVKTNQQTRRNKGFGFVTFSDPAAAAHVLGSAEKHTIDGKRVEVKRFDHTAFGRGARGGEELGGSRRGPRDRDSREPSRRGARDRDHRSRSRDRPPRRPTGGHDADWFCSLADRVNPAFFDLDYSIEFAMPNKSCGALLGRGGQLVREVEQEARVCITFSKKDDVQVGVPEGYRKISIKGSLISVYGAHMLLMRNYNEAEKEFHQTGPAKRRIEELQRELEALQSQVRGP